MMVQKTRCQYISKIGARCHADLPPGKEYCLLHDPEEKKKRAEARRQTSEVSAREMGADLLLDSKLPVLPLQKASDVVELLSETIDHVCSGMIDLRAARVIGNLASLLLRAFKDADQRPAAQLAQAINQLRRGEISLLAAKTVGLLANPLLRALKQAGIEELASEGEADHSKSHPHPTGPEAVLARLTATKARAEKQAKADGAEAIGEPVLAGLAGAPISESFSSQASKG